MQVELVYHVLLWNQRWTLLCYLSVFRRTHCFGYGDLVQGLNWAQLAYRYGRSFSTIQLYFRFVILIPGLRVKPHELLWTGFVEPETFLLNRLLLCEVQLQGAMVCLSPNVLHASLRIQIRWLLLLILYLALRNACSPVHHLTKGAGELGTIFRTATLVAVLSRQLLRRVLLLNPGLLIYGCSWSVIFKLFGVDAWQIIVELVVDAAVVPIVQVLILV